MVDGHDEHDKSNEALFPEHLDAETQGAGAATALLQTMLKVTEYDAEGELQIDGIYGPITEKTVQALQADLSVETDGKFGPETRAAFLSRFGIDVNTIPAGPFLGHA